MPSIQTDVGRAFAATEEAAGRPLNINTVKFAEVVFPDPVNPPAPSAALTDLVRGLPAVFEALLTQSGYQKLPGGLVIQWGIRSVGAGSQSIPLPIAFPTSQLMAVATQYTTSAGVHAVRVTGLSTTTVYVESTYSGTGQISISFIALGY